jgi:hypothetical protein
MESNNTVTEAHPLADPLASRISAERFSARALSLGVDELTVARATQVYAAGQATLFGASGKMGSGNDTVCDTVAARLFRGEGCVALSNAE